MSVNFMPGHLVRQFHVRQFHVRHFQSTPKSVSRPFSDEMMTSFFSDAFYSHHHVIKHLQANQHSLLQQKTAWPQTCIILALLLRWFSV